MKQLSKKCPNVNKISPLDRQLDEDMSWHTVALFENIDVLRRLCDPRKHMDNPEINMEACQIWSWLDACQQTYDAVCRGIQ